ncbi:hypothetical protein Ahy_B09g098111 isoform C [Arachis hypogaea]|uniref:DUF668 domain-containing protein n=1 Tax=Arachis hypogaea TaxID=3818 RepID=A0A444XQL4_ARAHY|nr:hypothetical protein Ahy_B09g098111 isoform C [Arachis hypogaea]
MVAEAWFVKMGNQVSSNLKHALLLETSSGKRKQQQHSSTIKNNDKVTIDILSFEVANVMSKTVHLHKSLSDSEISRLRNEILTSEAVRSLVSSDHSYLLDLALAEKLDELNRVAGVVSRLGKKCSVPALQGFEHVYGDIVSGVIDVNELGFLVKHMEGMVRKMDRYVSNTKNLYSEMEVLNQLEQAMNKFQNNQNEESRRVFEQKLAWQRQDVRHLKEISLWNQTFDKVVELLARTVCTIYARMSVVFGDSALRKNSIGLAGGSPPPECGLVSGQISVPMPRMDMRRGDLAYLQPEDFVLPCGTSPGRLFMECLRNNVKKKEQSCHSSGFDHAQISIPFNGDLRAKSGVQSCSTFGPKSRLAVYASPSTLGGCALALHYANVIIVLEKLLSYPHLVGEEARDDLYQMLPTSLRLSLKAKLKSYVKNLAIYDAPLAHDWKVTLDGILRGLAPLAHNMIRWQSERNFEQHQIVSRTNVLLLQTLYFADKEKTEEAICEILIGLNYICRYEHQQNALLDCASSFDFEDCLEWQLQCGSSLLN